MIKRTKQTRLKGEVARRMMGEDRDTPKGIPLIAHSTPRIGDGMLNAEQARKINEHLSPARVYLKRVRLNFERLKMTQSEAYPLVVRSEEVLDHLWVHLHYTEFNPRTKP